MTRDRASRYEEKTKKLHRVERAYGAFVRSFTLPTDSDEEKVRAEFKDGMLRLHVGKTEKAKAKSIEVEVG